MSEILQRLRELAQLLDSGHINRKEFERAKKRVFAEEKEAAIEEPHGDLPKRIGSYRLRDVIGEGGMGRVFRARHRSESMASRQGGVVALKILHAQHARNPTIRKRFEQEATLGTTLQHPGIVRTFELIAEEGHIGLVMELVEGQTLAAILDQRDSWAWSEVLPLLSQIMDAVSYAHGEGVIHRDLKPENIVVQPNGRLKILDFGIAKSARLNLTKTGHGLGTVDYMAPEQFVNAKSVDERADIYSLGIILYKMLAGRLPWDAGLDHSQIFHRKNTAQLASPTLYRPTIPGELSDLVMRMLAPKPGERFEDMAALRATVAAIDHMVGKTVLLAPNAPIRRPPAPPPLPVEKNWSLNLAVFALILFFLGTATVGVAVYLKLDEMAEEEAESSKEEDEDRDDDEDPDSEEEGLTQKERSEYKVRIRTDTPDEVHELARKLRTLGYKVRTQTQPPDTWSIQWNSAPEEMIDEILDSVSLHLQTSPEDFEKIDSFEANPRDIVLNIRFKIDTEAVRNRHAVQLRTNQPDRVQLLLMTLEIWGYQTSVIEEDVSRHAIQWGTAPDWLAEEVLGIVSEDVNIPTDLFIRRNSERDEDSQVIVSLPFDEEPE